MAIKWRREEPLAYELIRLMRDSDPAAKKPGRATAAATPAPKTRPAPAPQAARRASPMPEPTPRAAPAASVPPPKPVAQAAVAPARKRERRSDLMVAALGITLGLICALFPWYIFFNPDEFGIRAMKFSGSGGADVSGPIALSPQPERVGAPMQLENPPELELDLFATGTLPTAGEADGNQAISALDQPFPVEEPFFKIIHIENGRAMLEDENGLWVVQRGSVLPDNTKVTSIEERDGRWVVVANGDRVIELTP
jgi:hypothetical protein